MADRIENLSDFVAFVTGNIKGSEKSEAQTFLNSFFQAFGYGGAIQAGARYEEVIKNSSKTGKTGFADLVWDGRILIEMKSRGVNLRDRQIWEQAGRYYLRLKKENRPRYVMFCNFDEFHIYDFDNQSDEPVDIIHLEELPHCESAFSFMRGSKTTPLFRNNQIVLTEKAARRLGDLYNALIERGRDRRWREYSELQAQRFVLQCVLAMFAEDLDLLPDNLFTRCVKDCIDNKLSSFDVLGGLFQAMNTVGVTPAGRYQDVQYFNGGLFKEIHPIELEIGELRILETAAGADWSKVRPSIFGNIFEGAFQSDEGKKKRHAHGIHFTSEGDIKRIVLPTIADYWRDRISAVNTLTELQALHEELSEYKILDPACGSGNFLYVAYQELKSVEFDLLQRLQGLDPLQEYMSLVTPQQFFGMDINSFAVELAKVTLMIGRGVAIWKLNLPESSLPLDTLDQNIVCKDALFTDWVKADAIIGNPPFLGGSRIRKELGDDYAERVFARFGDINAQVDFASYWFRLAHECLDENGRSGLVATNSISQGKSRAVSLDYIVQNDGYIYDAVSTQSWSGEANVHVSIINWSKIEPQTYHLDNVIVNSINSSLKSSVDVSNVSKIKANLNTGFVGAQPNSKGFFISEQQAKDWIKADPKNKFVIKSSCSATDLTDNPNGLPSRWIIDFQDMQLEEVSDYKLPFEHIKTFVKPERINNREAVLREKWWRFKRTNDAMRKALANLSIYFVVPCHSKWFVFLPAQPDWLPNNSITAIASDDFYVLGILTSKVHRQWVKVQSSTLEDRTRYTHNTCFETFPFPQIALTPQPPLPRGEEEQDSESEPLSPRERGRGEGLSSLAGRERQIPEVLLQRARELRQKQTSAEKILWECLRDRRLFGAKFRRQHNIGQYIADFYCHEAKLVIELDGEIHQTQQEHDRDRDQWMLSNGFTVIRFLNQDIFDDLEQSLMVIGNALTPQPPLPRGEEEQEISVKSLSSAKNKRTKKEILLPSPLGRGVGGEGIISKIRAAMQELHQYRSQQMDSKQWGITKLYNEYFHEPASQLYKLHAKLDKLVMQAYGFSEDDDILSKLLELNMQLGDREKQGLPVIGARG